MAKNDDLDLIRLFGLSREEASGLGLDAGADGAADNALPQEAEPPDAPQQSQPDSLPLHAEPAPVLVAPGTAADGWPFQPASEDALLADELALLALLGGAEPSAGEYSGHGALRGLSLADTAIPLHSESAVPGALQSGDVPDEGDEGDDISDPVDDARWAVLAGWADDAGDGDMEGAGEFDVAGASELDVDGAGVLDVDGAGDVDLAALFGLSSQEALGLGLSLAAPPAEEALGLGLGLVAPPSAEDAAYAPLGTDTPLTLTPAQPETVLFMADDAPAAQRALDIDPDLLDAFAEESAELLDGLHVELERLEADVADFGALRETRRIVHTLKGGAKMCRFEAVVALTHSCENLLDLVADGAVALDGAAVQALFDCEPVLRAAVQDAICGVATDTGPALALAARFDAFCAAVEPAPETASGGAPEDDDEAAQPAELLATPDGLPYPAGEWGEDRPASSHMAAAEAESGNGGSTADGANRNTDEDGHVDAAGLPIVAATEAAPGATAMLPARDATAMLPARDAATAAAAGAALDPAMETAFGMPVAPAPPALDGLSDDTADGASTAGETALLTPVAGSDARPAGRRGTNSINVDLGKVDAVVAKITELAAHRVSSHGVIAELMETSHEARRNVTRLRNLVMQIGNECAGLQPEEAQADDDLNLESFNALNTLLLQLQEAVSDQQALVQTIHDTISSHWSLQATESRVDADIQSALMSIRLVPIASMRVRLDGVVRQAAQATGKMIRWQLQGGSVAVEKNVFDRLFEPLMHLLRNAVDHGIETPVARRQAGKAETGSINVSASQEGNQIIIAVSDDGGGIVPNKVAALAVERGLITAEQANSMTYHQKIGLIFTPGFSTAGQVSHISGRGVGMDAVREACLRMGGSIDVSSRPGVGTTFTMRLPLSLSVMRGLIVRDGGCLMALPVAQVIALHLVPAADVVETPRGRVARIEGQELPVYNLPPLPGAAPAGYVQNGEVNVLQVAHQGGSIGLLIEDVVGEQEILIKAPPLLLRGVKTLLGAYVLPDGRVAPVVNLPQLLVDLRPVATLVAQKEEHKGRELTALVVDDSMSMRVALTGTLQSAGFAVLTARDGQEALDVLKREGLPSLVTLDVEMPRMDGLETLFALRQMPGAQDLPVFMLTSRGGAKHRRAAEQLGATRYFTKPYRDSELATAAREACAGAITT